MIDLTELVGVARELGMREERIRIADHLLLRAEELGSIELARVAAEIIRGVHDE